MAGSLNKLEKRILGKSNLEVSRLCYGTLAFSIYHRNLSVEKSFELLKKGCELGINFWDTAELYETYSHLRYALEKLDYPIVISSRSYAKSYKDMRISIEKCLKELGKDNIEIFGLHEIQIDEFDGKYFRSEAMKALIDARQEGLIKAISITTHSAKAAEIAADIEEIDVIMVLINYKGIGIKDGTLKDMELAIKRAKNNDKGIYAMKILAGGSFAGDIENAVNYIINNPDIDSAAIGMDSMDELLFNVSMLTGEKSLNLKEKLKSKERKIYVEPWCIGCGNCIKICPQGAIKMKFSQASVDSDKCVLCGYCISGCKDFYIKFMNEMEL